MKIKRPHALMIPFGLIRRYHRPIIAGLTICLIAIWRRGEHRPVTPGPIKVQLIGGFSITFPNGHRSTLRSQRARALFAYLVLHPDRDFTRSVLADQIWYPHDGKNGERWDKDAKDARGYLNTELSILQKLFADEGMTESPIQATTTTVRVLLRNVQTDVQEFRSEYYRLNTISDPALRHDGVTALAAAVRNRPTLLPDLHDDWLQDERNQLDAEIHQVCSLAARPRLATSKQFLPDFGASLMEQQLSDFLRQPAQSSIGYKSEGWAERLKDLQYHIMVAIRHELKTDDIPHVLVSTNVLEMWEKYGLQPEVLALLDKEINDGRIEPTPSPWVHAIIGRIAWGMGNLEKCEKHKLLAIRELRKLKQWGGLSSQFMGMMSLCTSKNDFEGAERYAYESIKVSQEHNLKLNVLYAYEGIIEIRIKNGKFDGAMEIVRIGDQYAREIGSKLWTDRLAYHKAAIFAGQGKIREGLSQLSFARRGLDPEIAVTERIRRYEDEVRLLQQMKLWDELASVRREYLEFCCCKGADIEIQTCIVTIVNGELTIQSQNHKASTTGYSSARLTQLASLLNSHRITTSLPGTVPHIDLQALAKVTSRQRGLNNSEWQAASQLGSRTPLREAWRLLP